jgi:hypothetical protein
MRAKLRWGYAIPYLVTGYLNQRPRTAMKFMEETPGTDIVKFYDGFPQASQLITDREVDMTSSSVTRMVLIQQQGVVDVEFSAGIENEGASSSFQAGGVAFVRII